jgi:hypothetical protein
MEDSGKSKEILKPMEILEWSVPKDMGTFMRYTTPID